MDEGSITGSLDRIEIALDRIEAAAQARPDHQHLAELETRHSRLKAGVGDAIARIDALIGTEQA